MFCKNRGDIRPAAGTFGDFFFSARHFWGFPLFRPALLGISSFSPGTLGISTLPPAGRKKDAFKHFNRGRKPNFRCRRVKKLAQLCFGYLTRCSLGSTDGNLPLSARRSGYLTKP
ncbi:Uncharacterized protein FWK35_00026214 [Aphis craccivora]|uniref:Uncharacterized protein n=1 Tax=Aphis craccivora TaxID=307492 RepID=A0A6G0YA17_APHCR|nr:Uncharacterized protein FWK35_00026214 [Aphis craccivora]